MNIKSRLKKLEEKTCSSCLFFTERIICEVGETADQAIKRLGINANDGVRRIVRVIVEPNHSTRH